VRRPAVRGRDAACRLRGATVLYPAAITRFEGGSEADLDAGRRVQVRGVLSPDRTRLVALGIRFIE